MLYKSQARTPGGRQPISENRNPFGPKNHSICVAAVPIPIAELTVRPSDFKLVIGRRLVDLVGGDELRRNPTRPHCLQHIRVIVRDEFVHDLPADGERIIEAFVPLDELLDSDFPTSSDIRCVKRQLTDRPSPRGWHRKPQPPPAV